MRHEMTCNSKLLCIEMYRSLEAHPHIYMSEQNRLPTKPFDDFTNSKELANIGEVPTILSIKTYHDSFFSGNFR